MRAIPELLALVLLAAPAYAQSPGPEWRFSQEAAVAREGWVKVSLPLATLGAARPDLADLRLRGPGGEEVSYLLERPTRRASEVVGVEDMRLSMTKGGTVVTGLVPPAGRDYDALLLRTPAAEFLKAVTLEVSEDGVSWRTVVASYPIFRTPGGGESTAFEFKRSAAPYLRVTLDDALTPPIPVEGLALYTGARDASGLQTARAEILQSISDARQTELTLSLPAEHLLLNSVVLEASDPAFSRSVSVLAKTFSDGDLRETPLASGTVWRLAGREKLSVPLRAQVPGSTLVLRVANGDNRPLSVQGVSLEIVPSALIFHAPRPGTYRLWSGHAGASAPDYDLGALRERMGEAAFQPAEAGPLLANPDYRAPEALPGVASEGGPLDVSSWRYRKPVSVSAPGLLRLELDLEVLARAQRGFGDLRLVREGVQIPYVLDAGGVSRTLKAEARESSKENLQSWTIELPLPGLPLTRLKCAAKAGVFTRRARLFENRTDERGDVGKRLLGEAVWVRTQGGAGDLSLELAEPPRSAELTLEVENGDNRPLVLGDFRADYQSRRILFKAGAASGVYLYYGQPSAGAPVYDLSLVAGQLLTQKTLDAGLGLEESLHAKPWWEAPKPEGPLKYAFWAVMALVTGGLILVIAKLLPQETARD